LKFYKIPVVFLSLSFSIHTGQAQYQKLHKKAIVVDTHNDILENCIAKGFSFDQDLRGRAQSDLERFKEGGVDVQIFSIWCDGKQADPFTFANRMIDTLYATAERHPDKIKVVYSSHEMLKAVRRKKLAAMISTRFLKNEPENLVV